MAMRLEWRGDFRFQGTDSKGAEVPMDAESKAGPKLSDLLPLSLAACLAYDVVNVMRKQRQDLTGLSAAIDAIQDPDPPFRFRRISVTFEVSGNAIAEHAVERSIRAAKKDCSVLHSLDPEVEVEVGYRIPD